MTGKRRFGGSVVALVAMLGGGLAASPVEPSGASDRPVGMWSEGSDGRQQLGQGRGRRGRGPAAEGLTVLELERYFDSYEVIEAQRALGLNDDEFLVVGQRLRRLQSVRRRQLNEQRRLMNGLRAALGSGQAPVDQEAIAAALQALNEFGVRQEQERRRALQALDAILTMSQRARFRLFQERFERQKLDLLSRARQVRRGGGPPSEGPPRR
jgi:hypothetical protein